MLVLGLLACGDSGRTPAPEPPPYAVSFTDTAAPADTGTPVPRTGLVEVLNETGVGLSSFYVFWDGGGLSSHWPFSEFLTGHSIPFEDLPVGFVRLDVRGIDDTCAWTETTLVDGELFTWTVRSQDMTGQWDATYNYCGY